MKKSAHRPEWGSNSEPDEYESTVHQVPISGQCNDTNVCAEKFVSRSDWQLHYDIILADRVENLGRIMC
jgi:hypothetical protein